MDSEGQECSQGATRRGLHSTEGPVVGLSQHVFSGVRWLMLAVGGTGWVAPVAPSGLGFSRHGRLRAQGEQMGTASSYSLGARGQGHLTLTTLVSSPPRRALDCPSKCAHPVLPDFCRQIGWWTVYCRDGHRHPSSLEWPLHQHFSHLWALQSVLAPETRHQERVWSGRESQLQGPGLAGDTAQTPGWNWTWP